MANLNNTKYLGIDYGEKVIGLATYQPGTDPFALIHGRIIVKNDQTTFSELKTITNDEAIDAIILGLPFYTDGKESDMTKKVRLFGEKLHQKINDIPLHFQDETLSSFEAEERMKNDPRYNFKVDPKMIDALSAVIIIESFINDGNL